MDYNGTKHNKFEHLKTKSVNQDLSQEFLDDLMEECNEYDNVMDSFNNCNVIGRNKYMREIQPGVWVDVYDVIEAWGVTDGGFQHALKKILACGSRGHKDEEEDRKDIHMSIKRSNEIFEHKRLEN